MVKKLRYFTCTKCGTQFSDYSIMTHCTRCGGKVEGH